MRPFYRLARSLAYVFFMLAGGRVMNIRALHRWHGGILAANHISLFDPPLIGAVTPVAIHFLAKRELFENWLLGPAIRRLNAIPIRRGTIDRHAMTQATEVLQRGESIVIFPEGSRRNFTARPGIGKLAVQSGVPVLPIYLENTDRPWSCLLRKRRMRVVIGEPIPAAQVTRYEDSKAGYRALAEYILDRINALGETASSATAKGESHADTSGA